MEEKRKEAFRNVFKGLQTGLKKALKEWERREGWDDATWVETVEALIRGFADYREAEQWIRNTVLEVRRDRS